MEVEDELDEIIKEIAQLWPDCRMVKGAPYHSATNGGVERFNRTIQGKIMNWMRHNNSTNWSIGGQGTDSFNVMYIDLLTHFVYPLLIFYTIVVHCCCARIVCTWQYNSSRHRGVGNNIPYQLVFGQVPQVGISHLPLSPALIASLNTEAQYRHALLRIEDDGGMEHDGNERNDHLQHAAEETVGIADGTDQDVEENNDDLLHAEVGSFFIGDGTPGDIADSERHPLSNPPPPPSSGRKLTFLTISLF
jgi:hypothetical protein